MHTSGLHHLAISAGAAGVETVARFWREVAGLEEITTFRRDDGTVRSVWLALEPGGGAANGFLAVEAHDPAHPYGPAMIALRISKEDRERILGELKARNVTVEQQSRWTVYFYDPAGNRVGLSHHPHD